MRWGAVQGAAGHLTSPLPLLAQLSEPVMESYLLSQRQDALAMLERRIGGDRAVLGLDSAWLAARWERPEMLAVEQGYFQPVRLSPDGDLLTPADDAAHPEVIDDIVDELIEIVPLRGGWVALLDDGRLPQAVGVALSLRR